MVKCLQSGSKILFELDLVFLVPFVVVLRFSIPTSIIRVPAYGTIGMPNP
jgi:hypothetical protein